MIVTHRHGRPVEDGDELVDQGVVDRLAGGEHPVPDQAEDEVGDGAGAGDGGQVAALNGAIEAMVKPLAAELAPIRVNGVSPGVVDTPWWRGMPEEARAGFFAQMEKQLPTRRVATAEDIAEVVALAATNPNLTATVIEADGGARIVAGV